MVGIVHQCSADDWAQRSPENKLGMVAREVKQRLTGLSTVFYGLAFLPCGTVEEAKNKMIFFAEITKDMAEALRAAEQELSEKLEMEWQADTARTRSRRRVKPTIKRGAAQPGTRGG